MTTRTGFSKEQKRSGAAKNQRCPASRPEKHVGPVLMLVSTGERLSFAGIFRVRSKTSAIFGD
jgi:hypothetical protein